jgi:hypothetical protein
MRRKAVLARPKPRLVSVRNHNIRPLHFSAQAVLNSSLKKPNGQWPGVLRDGGQIVGQKVVHSYQSPSVKVFYLTCLNAPPGGRPFLFFHSGETITHCFKNNFTKRVHSAVTKKR